MNNQLFLQFETFKSYFWQRKLEIEDLILLLQDRAKAEDVYAQSLEKMVTRKQKSIKFGLLAQEVESFKQNCASKARQAQELADNMLADVVDPLKQLITSQSETFDQIVFEGKLMIQNLSQTDQIVKDKIIKYFKSAKEMEEYLVRYNNAKDKKEVGFRQKDHLYKCIHQNFEKTKENERDYKIVVDKANAFITKFIQKMEELTKQLKDLEKVRVEAVHSAINKFVVYEKFSEMNNKYDITNFSKILDEFKEEKEMETIEKELADPDQVDPATIKYSFGSYSSENLELGDFDFKSVEAPFRTSPEKENEKKSDIFEMFNYVMNIEKMRPQISEQIQKMKPQAAGFHSVQKSQSVLQTGASSLNGSVQTGGAQTWKARSPKSQMGGGIKKQALPDPPQQPLKQAVRQNSAQPWPKSTTSPAQQAQEKKEQD